MQGSHEWKTPISILMPLLKESFKIKVHRPDILAPLHISLFDPSVFVKDERFNLEEDNLPILRLIEGFAKALIYEARLNTLVNEYLETADAKSKKAHNQLFEAVEKLIKMELTHFEQRIDAYITDMLLVRAGILEAEQITPNATHSVVLNMTRPTPIITMSAFSPMIYIVIAEMTGYMPIPLYAGLDRDNAMNVDLNVGRHRDKNVADEMIRSLEHAAEFGTNRCIVEMHVYQSENPIEIHRYNPKTKEWTKTTNWEV